MEVLLADNPTYRTHLPKLWGIGRWCVAKSRSGGETKIRNPTSRNGRAAWRYDVKNWLSAYRSSSKGTPRAPPIHLGVTENLILSGKTSFTPRANFMQSQQTVISPTQNVKHCRSCWREDIHKPARISPMVYGSLVVISFGLILALKPSRCVCCGTMRVL